MKQILASSLLERLLRFMDATALRCLYSPNMSKSVLGVSVLCEHTGKSKRTASIL